MRGARYKRSGWFGESYRHSLAAKGISSYNANKYANLPKGENKPRIAPEFAQEYGVYLDNPGGSWLERKQRMWEDGTIDLSGSVTATVRGPVSVQELLKLPGQNKEHLRMDDEYSRRNIDAIKQVIQNEGFDAVGPGYIVVWPDGTVTIGEGNHRVRALAELGYEEVPWEIQYRGGGEDSDSPWNLENFQKRRGYMAKKVDLNKYAGTWTQESVQNEPWFQRGCEDVQATYEVLPEGSVKVTNTCVRDGEVDSITGKAYPLTRDNRKLLVQFGNNIFTAGKYEIVKVNDDYTRAIVRSGDTEWVLTRDGDKMMAKKLTTTQKKAKFERCVKAVAKKNPDGKAAAYPICTDSLGYQIQDGEVNYTAKKKRDLFDRSTDFGARLLKAVYWDAPKEAFERGKKDTFNALKVPKYAKTAAKRALKEREEFSDPPGLTKREANRKGINSGVERAKQLVRSKSIPDDDARRVAAFYQRFKNMRTPRAEVAIDLWGGRRFGKRAVKHVENLNE